MADQDPGRGRGHQDQQTSRPLPKPHPYHPTARVRSPQQSPPQSPPPIQTQNLPPQGRQRRDRGQQQTQDKAARFSWTETPVDALPRPTYTIVSPSTTIDESPLSAAPPAHPTRSAPQQQYAQDQGYYQDPQYQYTESAPPLPQMPSTPPQQTAATYSLYPKDRPSPERTTTPGAPRPHEVHPAFSAPYAEPEPAAPHASVPHISASPPPQKHRRTRTGSDGLPLRVLTSPISPAAAAEAKAFPHGAPPVPESTDTKNGAAGGSVPTTPAISTPRLAPRTPTYDPNSLAGPNVQIGGDAHRPGQISHPNAARAPEWQGGGLAKADALCFEAVFCPCAVYGRVQHRLAQKAARREPTDLLGYSCCNGSCVGFSIACGLQGILAMIQRARVRKAYRIDGSIVSDCLRGCCCCCCVLAQSEREVRGRETAMRRHAGPASSAVPYITPAEMMSYEPPPR